MTHPRHHTPRSDRPTRGDGVAKLATAKQRPLMPWQRAAVDVALEVDPATGLYRYSTVVISVPRQSGKTKLIGDVADHRCLTVPRARVWITQQSGKDAAAWMRDEHFDELAKAEFLAGEWAKSLRAGEVGVTWNRLKSTFRAFPPKRDGLHGKQGDLIFPDEAWAHDAVTGSELRQAIRATMATRKGSQLWIVSTRGDDRSAYLQSYIDLAEASLGNPTSRVAYIDYGLSDDDDPNDLELVASKHPAYGHTISMQSLIDAREEFRNAVAADGSRFDDIAGWARAYGNRHTQARKAAFNPSAWKDCAGAHTPIPERVGLAFDVTPDGATFALGAGWRDTTGKAHIELIDEGPTSRGLPDQIAALARARRVPVLYESTALGTLDIVDAITERHPTTTLTRVTGPEYGSACLVIRRDITRGNLAHPSQPALTAATEVLTTRPLGDGSEGWGRAKSTGNIAPFVAVTLALRGYDTLPKPTGRARILLAS